jgi:hypothetical protein
LPAHISLMSTFHTGAQAFNHPDRRDDILLTFRSAAQCLHEPQAS